MAAIAALALLSAVAPLATDMYLPAFPVMAEQLGASAAGIQVTLTAFLAGLAGGQLLIGPLSDRFGRRKPLLAGTALAIVSGLFCAFAADVGHLVVWRFLQGLGGAAGVVLARAVIADRARSAIEAARLFQVMMIIGGLAPVLAPSVGAGVVALAGWRAVFVVLAVLSTVSLVGVLRCIDESLPAERRARGGVPALLRTMGQVLANRSYLGYVLMSGFIFMVLFGYISASPFVFQSILGLSPAAYSLAFGANAIGIAVVSAISARWLGRVPPQRLVAIGIGTCLLASLLVLLCVLTGAGPALMLPCVFLAICPVGMTLGNASALAISQAPGATGSASALLGAMQFLLGAVASPLVGLGGKDTAVPMALTMAVSSMLAVLCFALLAHRGSRRAEVAAAA
ncbi:MAG: multidrug effflux MFS transporter [Hydrogenophaga sp.]|jgi:DHA1 family bicyclomycin/chloramphenicol resistance-like MFS transporter|nr:multidrug effflux MFS transporter [Hydrogenophaga sp.]MDD3785156.1 multidrug effflux MFS transporter [Hydrogenophaga sp.]MDX9967892.1 multidrug effflux MFS transporter [Hydrogenophaga sp.]